ncbi:uncharacterized protein LOC128234704 isoform X2 [Mya arenaria]|uniref:uncharacterized protein LOC128234704 isoform X2 n=1 Tax=Mya arenaria TaxID=6604 RepID=UPI0022E3B41F|nr:uncharacterized protein LOC128234704 isoform X2 [Mya arenaria]
MLPPWIIKGVRFAVRLTALFGLICVARKHYGTISVVGPAFLNREVTLKATPSYPWGCEVEWKYIMEGSTYFQTMNGTNVKRYSEDGSFFLKWKASIEYNRSDFYAGCSTNTTIVSSLIALNVKEIVGQCGALVILSPVVRGGDVKLGYFPSDYSIQQINTTRTWKTNIQDIELRKGGHTDSVQLHIPEPPSYPILGPKIADFNTTKCIYVYEDSDIYCQTENGTEPVQVALLLGQDLFVLAESEQNNGFYLFSNVHQHMAGLSNRNVTCQVSNAAIETPYEVQDILCNVEKGSQPDQTVPEYLDGANSSTTCEVRNAFPAPVRDIHIGNVLLSDVQQTDLFNGSSHTYASTAKVTKTHKLWNGKEMCCTRKSIDDFGIADHSICNNISIKYPPSDISMSVSKKPEYSDSVSAYFMNLSCETNESNPPCVIEWASNRDDLRYINSGNWTYGEHGSFVSNVIYKVTKDMVGGIITCSTRCNHFSSHLTENYVVSFSGDPTLYLNMTSSVELYPKNTLTVKCRVYDCNAKEKWTLRWEAENNTEIKTC